MLRTTIGIAWASALIACSGGSQQSGNQGTTSNPTNSNGTASNGSETDTTTTKPTDPTTGGTSDNQPADSKHAAAMALFQRKCAGCHVGNDRSGPELGAGYNSRAWVRGFLANPNDSKYFGETGIDKMKPVKATGAKLDALVEYVYSETGAADADQALAKKGKSMFENGSCGGCHETDGTSEADPGPNLKGRGTVEYLVEFIANPADKRWFGKLNEMPKFGDKLSEAERRQLAELLISWRDAK